MTHLAVSTRPPGTSRAARVVASVLLAIAVTVAAPVAAHAVPANQDLVVLTQSHVAYTAPDPTSSRIHTIAARRPLSRIRTTLPVEGRATASDGSPWIQVRLSGRPSQPLGWINAVATRAKSTPWRLRLDVSNRRLTIYHYGRAVKRFSTIVGKSSTPTPTGEFFVEEALALSGRSTGGPYALATSARSAVLQEFAGGPGQIAIHGMGNLSGRMGTAISHGCIRLDYSSISWLAKHVGSGTPLKIKR